MRLSADCFVAIYDSADESMSFFGLLLPTAHCLLPIAHCCVAERRLSLAQAFKPGMKHQPRNLRRRATVELSPAFQGWDHRSQTNPFVALATVECFNRRSREGLYFPALETAEQEILRLLATLG
jgi:hypothetical protein